MSNSDNLAIEKHEVETFVVVEHGSSKVSLAVFEYGYQKTAGASMTPEQAEIVAAMLVRHANEVRGGS